MTWSALKDGLRLAVGVAVGCALFFAVDLVVPKVDPTSFLFELNSSQAADETAMPTGSSPITDSLPFRTIKAADIPTLATLAARTNRTQHPECQKSREERTKRNGVKYRASGWDSRLRGKLSFLTGLDYYWSNLRHDTCALNPGYIFDIQRKGNTFAVTQSSEERIWRTLESTLHEHATVGPAGELRTVVVFHNGAPRWLPFLLSLHVSMDFRMKGFLVVTTSHSFFEQCSSLGLVCWHASPLLSRGSADKAVGMGSAEYNDFIAVRQCTLAEMMRLNVDVVSLDLDVGCKLGTNPWAIFPAAGELESYCEFTSKTPNGGSLHLQNRQGSIQHSYERACALALWSSAVLRETLLLAATINYTLSEAQCSRAITSPSQLGLDPSLRETAKCIHATGPRETRKKAKYLKDFQMWHVPDCLPESSSDDCYARLVEKYWEARRKLEGPNSSGLNNS
eukprot:TRINITY_DN18384_c0_g1_i2.p1 TRINITY_DN18384_c0_g1~~TRINITY_DN18384_c0_g1_i2.p1  ORF type:complete len:452 (-),score=37.45 TRINITY_DN18384_c0_g1_i2:70-1425(-)